MMPGSLVVVVPSGTLLMDAVREAARPLASACGGEGICARCRVTVLSGSEHLSPPDDLEVRIARMQRLGGDERIACRARVLGDVSVTHASWGSAGSAE